MTTIIGFGHRSRSGKDTAAATIIAALGRPVCHGVCVETANGTTDLGMGSGLVSGLDVRRYAFADALKREVNDAAEAVGGMESLFEPYAIPSGNWDGNKTYVVLPEWVKFDPNAPMDDPLCPNGKQRLLLQWWGTEYRRAQDEDYWVKQLKKSVDEDQPEFALVTDFRFENEAKVLDFKVKVDRDVLVNDHPSEHALDNFEGWDFVVKNDSDLAAFQERVIKTFDFIRDFVVGRLDYHSMPKQV